MLQELVTSQQIRRAIVACCVALLCVGIALWQRGSLERDVRQHLVSDAAYARFDGLARDKSLGIGRVEALRLLGEPARIAREMSTVGLPGDAPAVDCGTWYATAATAGGDPAWEHVVVCFDGAEITGWSRGDPITADVLAQELRGR